MDINVLKQYLNIECELWLSNGRQYSGKIINFINYTIIFLNNENIEIPFEAKSVEIIQPKKSIKKMI